MKNSMHLFFWLIMVLNIPLSSCQTEEPNPNKEIVAEFFKVFNKRQDFERFLDFYNDTAVLEDIINGDRIEGKQALRSFFDWSNPDFELVEESSLVVKEITVDDNRVVVSGYFTPFKWGDTEFEAMHFTTLLTLNESGKIIKQVDWINYPSNLVNYNTRKNSNTWLR
ncbi:nuclear transport factor 2 family protein [Flagellimonas sp.]|uniref:nuclear transport factor 2 family protein n=1 Tax=Flagellimonas sp. TaxID=2058762 RepID=UPI003BB121E2